MERSPEPRPSTSKPSRGLVNKPLVQSDYLFLGTGCIQHPYGFYKGCTQCDSVCAELSKHYVRKQLRKLVA